MHSSITQSDRNLRHLVLDYIISTGVKVVKESKVVAKELKVVSLSQIESKWAPEISIPALNKRMKLTKEVEDTDDDNDNRLIIQKILLKQLGE